MNHPHYTYRSSILNSLNSLYKPQKIVGDISCKYYAYDIPSYHCGFRIAPCYDIIS